MLGSDEVFAVHTVLVGNGEPQIKRTGLVNGFDDGVVKAVAEADAGVFPANGQSQVPDAEVMIVTSLFEDDGSGLEPVFNVLRPLIGTAVVLAVEALNGDQKTLSEIQKTAIRVAVDSAVGAPQGPLSELLTQHLGSDVIVVRPNGQIVSKTGAPKTTLRFRKVRTGTCGSTTRSAGSRSSADARRDRRGRPTRRPPPIFCVSCQNRRPPVVRGG